jgi:hypothetical protein
MMVDAQDLRALAREGERGGAAVAHAFAGTLPGPDDDRDLVLQPHLGSLPGTGTIRPIIFVQISNRPDRREGRGACVHVIDITWNCMLRPACRV